MEKNNVREPLPAMDFPNDSPKCVEEACSSTVQTHFDNLVKSAFIKSLLATILAEIPVGWFIATFLGIAGLKTLKEATVYSEEHGLKTGGLYTASKVLGYVGMILGAYNSLNYILSIILSVLIIGLYFLFFLVIFVSGAAA